MATQLWLLVHLLALSTISVSGDVFINCGARSNFTDENKITWRVDDDLILNGHSHMVHSDYLSDYSVLDTLRAFNNTRKRNCYSLEAEKWGKVLVRVGFYYGNYDSNSFPPTFDLHFDGNFWINVNTSEPQSYEAIYVVKRKVISVCVSQTLENQFPFISTLEVRSIDSDVYSMIGPDYALLTNYRIGYGLINDQIRFPDDKYDRVWDSIGINNDLELVNNDATFINFTTSDDPPAAVLESAIASHSTNETIIFHLGTLLYPFSYPVYINWYFTEVKNLEVSENRSFMIYKDNQPFSDTIVPGFGNVSEYTASNLNVTLYTNFSIVATNDSTLPPLINAIEVFSISDALTNGTNDNDVEGLDSLKNAFDVLKSWSGDPCLPAPYSWDWIVCNNDSRPRVTSINLNGYNLSGPLPDFSSMNALEIIDLHNNSLTGTVPDFLGNMQNLEQLNLADNRFSGSIPSSILRNSQLNISDTGNSLLNLSNSNKKKTTKSLVILAITIPVFFIF